jgi:hypothetical protein
LPESYYDADKGPAYDRLITDFNNLTALKAENDLRLAARPKDPTGYQPTLPKDFKLPEGLNEFKIADDDPMLKSAREWAHKHNLSQEAFSDLIAMRAGLTVGEETNIKEMRDAEIKKLGDNGPARIDAITTWLSAKLGKKDPELANMLVTSGMVSEFETLIQKAGGAAASFSAAHPAVPAQGDAAVKENWSKMTRSQQLAYSREKEAAELANRAAAR